MRARLASLLTLVGLGLPASAQAITFGADLGAPADNTGTCALMGASSCTFYSGAPGPSFYAPATGTVTAVRVRTGAFAQGPMQIVVMRSLTQNKPGDPGHPYYACCFVEHYGPVFTPQANTVTTVPTSLAMVVDPTPPPEDLVSNARGDFLAITVLAANVPVPARADGASVFSGFAPAPTPQTAPAPGPNVLQPVSTGLGYHIAMNADLTPAGRTAGGGTAGRRAALAAAPRLTGRPPSMACLLPSACEGTLRLSASPVGLSRLAT